jgi:hypothetical protein
MGVQNLARWLKGSENITKMHVHMASFSDPSYTGTFSIKNPAKFPSKSIYLSLGLAEITNWLYRGGSRNLLTYVGSDNVCRSHADAGAHPENFEI